MYLSIYLSIYISIDLSIYPPIYQLYTDIVDAYHSRPPAVWKGGSLSDITQDIERIYMHIHTYIYVCTYTYTYVHIYIYRMKMHAYHSRPPAV